MASKIITNWPALTDRSGNTIKGSKWADPSDYYTKDEIDAFLALKTDIGEAMEVRTAVIADHKAAGTNGGTFTLGAWRTRDLNTIESSDIEGLGLAANQITLQAGMYLAQLALPCFQTNQHGGRLQDITNTLTLGYSTSWMYSGAASSQPCIFSVRFALSGPTVLEAQHQSQITAVGTGFGGQGNFFLTLPYERYSEVRIWQFLT